jgi:hypothetical protein
MLVLKQNNIFKNNVCKRCFVCVLSVCVLCTMCYVCCIGYGMLSIGYVVFCLCYGICDVFCVVLCCLLCVLCYICAVLCVVYVVCCDCGVRVSVGVCTCPRTCMHMWREADVACFLYSLVLCLFLSQDLPMNLLIGSALLTGASGIHLTLPRSK